MATPTYAAGYAGSAPFKRMRTDPGEAGFWMGRQFGVGYEFDIPSGGMQTIKVMSPRDTLLYSAQVHVDTGSLRYRVFGWPDESREVSPFNTSVPLMPLNTMSFTPQYAPFTEVSTGGEFDATGLVPFPVARVRTAENSVFRQTSGLSPGTRRGFGPGVAYVVMEPLTANQVTGVVEYRFEERDWGY